MFHICILFCASNGDTYLHEWNISSVIQKSIDRFPGRLPLAILTLLTSDGYQMLSTPMFFFLGVYLDHLDPNSTHQSTELWHASNQNSWRWAVAGPLGSCSAASRKAAATRACSLVLARPRHELWDAGNGRMEGSRKNPRVASKEERRKVS